MIRVVLVDDHPVVRTGYRRLLEQAGDIDVVAEAGDAAAGYAAFVSHRPDVLVTDLSMGGCGGLELIRHVLLRASDARVLVFSMHDGALLVRGRSRAAHAAFSPRRVRPTAWSWRSARCLPGNATSRPNCRPCCCNATCSARPKDWRR